MAKLIDVEVPDSLSRDEIESIQDWFRGKNKTDWEIFKENFNAFKESLYAVCYSFWHKLTTWITDLWNRIF